MRKASAVRVFFCPSNVSSVHLWLVANLYLLLLQYSVSQSMKENCEKYVVTHIRNGIPGDNEEK